MKKSEKGFTLIELLVVVAIIGILAAVGVVAYSGYVDGARKSAAKSNHGNIVKYVASEMKKCTIEGSTSSQMKDASGSPKLKCSDVGTTGKVAAGVVGAMAGEFENPYTNPGGDAVKLQAKLVAAATCSKKNRGQTLVDDDGTTFYVSTCFDDSSTAMFNTLLVE